MKRRGERKGEVAVKGLYLAGRLWVVVLLSLFLVACESSQPTKGVEKVQKAPQKRQPEVVEKVEALPPAEEGPARPLYNPEGRRDPFRPFIAATPVEKERKRPLTPLERYSLSQLRLVAIVWSEDGAVAMVEDPEGKGYSIRVGTRIGDRNGRVKKILKDRVIVVERFLDAFGKEKKEEVTLELPKEEEELLP